MDYIPVVRMGGDLANRDDRRFVWLEQLLQTGGETRTDHDRCESTRQENAEVL